MSLLWCRPQRSSRLQNPLKRGARVQDSRRRDLKVGQHPGAPAGLISAPLYTDLSVKGQMLAAFDKMSSPPTLGRQHFCNKEVRFGMVDLALKQPHWSMARATLVEDRAQTLLVRDMARASRNKSFGSSIPHSFLGTRCRHLSSHHSQIDQFVNTKIRQQESWKPHVRCFPGIMLCLKEGV